MWFVGSVCCLLPTLVSGSLISTCMPSPGVAGRKELACLSHSWVLYFPGRHMNTIYTHTHTHTSGLHSKGCQVPIGNHFEKLANCWSFGRHQWPPLFNIKKQPSNINTSVALTLFKCICHSWKVWLFDCEVKGLTNQQSTSQTNVQKTR